MRRSADSAPGRTFVQATGPANVLQRLFAVKQGAGPKWLSEDLLAVFQAWLTDPEFRSLYGIREFFATKNVAGVAAQFTTFQIGLPPAALSQFGAVLTDIIVVGGANFNIEAFTADAVIGGADAVPWSADLRLQTVAQQTPIVDLVRLLGGTQAGALNAALKFWRESALASTARKIGCGPIVLGGPTDGIQNLVKLQVDTVNIGCALSVRGYLFPVKPF